MLECFQFYLSAVLCTADVDEEDVGSVSNDDGRRSSSSSPLHSVHQLQVKRRRKQQQRLAGSTRVQELKVEASRKVGRKEKSDKEKEDGKKGKRKVHTCIFLTMYIHVNENVCF